MCWETYEPFSVASYNTPATKPKNSQKEGKKPFSTCFNGSPMTSAENLYLQKRKKKIIEKKAKERVAMQNESEEKMICNDGVWLLGHTLSTWIGNRILLIVTSCREECCWLLLFALHLGKTHVATISGGLLSLPYKCIECVRRSYADDKPFTRVAYTSRPNEMWIFAFVEKKYGERLGDLHLFGLSGVKLTIHVHLWTFVSLQLPACSIVCPRSTCRRWILFMRCTASESFVGCDCDEHSLQWATV